MKRAMISIAVLLLFVTAYVVVKPLKLDIKWHLDGIFLLKGNQGWHYELSDDLYVGDGERLIYTFADFHDPLFQFTRNFHPHAAYLYYEWDSKDGSGLFRNIYPDGRQLLTCFGRFVGDDKKRVQGLFVGGGLPESVAGKNDWLMNETGMTYFDGARWYHVWCNANEGLYAFKDMNVVTNISWQYLGSKVIDESSQTVAVMSNHLADLGDTSIRMDRYMYMNAGDTYFILTIRLANIGSKPALIQYVYGDEPWVGNYGSSHGNVGWVEGRLINYEMEIDSSKYAYAGYFHHGNEVAGEGHDYTNTANFIQWLGPHKPSVYFSNKGGELADKGGNEKIPLSSNERFIGLEWQPVNLKPGESVTYTLALGMATCNPKTGMPVKPKVTLPKAFQ